MSGLTYSAELVVIFDEGQKTESLVRLPIRVTPGQDAYRFRVDGRKVEVLK